MDPETVYRFASQREVTTILDLWTRARAHPTVTDNAASLAALIEFDPEAVMVAEVGERVVASIITGWNGWRGSLYRLAVDPEARRLGVGTALVAHAVEGLRTRGAQRIDAFVVAGDRAAVAFWDSLGTVGVKRDPLPKLRFVVE